MIVHYNIKFKQMFNHSPNNLKMSFSEFNPGEIDQCKQFLQKVLHDYHDDTDSRKQLTSLCFCMTYDEVEGEIIDILSRFLSETCCPQVLVSPLICMVKTKFMQKDLDPFQLKKQDVDIKEYDGSMVTKELHRCFLSTCSELLSNTSNLHKTIQNTYVCFHATKNKRRKMEDRHIFYEDFNGLFPTSKATCPQSIYAVFDGHGGTDAANYAASQFVCRLNGCENLISNPGDALRESIMKTDESFILKAKRERLKSGATVVAVLIQDKNLTVAWAGDSQVVLCKGGNAVQLMEPHKPDRQDERNRIESLGGCVVFFGGWRVNGSLSVSRAIGDYEQKPFITSEPDVEEYEMEGDEEFLILGCDGLWDTVEPIDAVEHVFNCVNKGIRDKSAEHLVELAKKNGSMDNITVMVVFLDFNTQQESQQTNEDDRGAEKHSSPS